MEPLSQQADPTRRIEADLERIAAVVRKGLEAEYGSATLPADFRLDTFVVVPVFVWTEEDGTPVDMPSVYGESRRLHVQRGALEAGRDALR